MYWCGIDVAKRQHAGIIVNEQRRATVGPFQISNDRAGFTQLLARLAPYQGQIQVGMEATGHYWLPLYAMLQEQGYPVVVINPLQIHQLRKLGLRKCKTDRVDARLIADWLQLQGGTPTLPDLPERMQLRELTRFRSQLTQKIGDAKRKVITALDRAFPEYETLFSDPFLASSRRLLAEAVSAEDFADLDLQELTTLLHTSSRGHFGLAQAQALQRLAHDSVGISFLGPTLRLEVQCLLQQIALFEAQRQEVEDAIETLCQTLPLYITSIPGVGLVNAATVVAEIGDIQRFDDADDLVAYAGIDPSVVRSGQFVGDQSHMSKRGSPHLRAAVWLAARGVILHEPEFRAYYQRKRAEGKPYGVAMGAVCNKLLRRIYVCLKNQRTYTLRATDECQI